MTAYTVIRSARRTLCLEIARDLTVVVRAPKRATQKQIEAFVASHEEWIRVHLEQARQRQQTGMERDVPAEEEQRLRRLAAEYIPTRVALYGAQMGLTPTGVKITGARRRFGSCSGKNSLCFSWRLMLYSPEAVDYVVVHELAHIRHHDHSAAFWRLVEQTMPDFRVRQRMLKD